MNVEQVHPIYVNQVWPNVAGFLKAGLEHSAGEYSVDQLRFMLVRGDQILLQAVKDDQIVGAASVVFENYPNARVALVTSVGGRMVASPECWSQLKAWCQANGATRVRGLVREEAARLWRQKFGFEQKYIIVEQQL